MKIAIKIIAVLIGAVFLIAGGIYLDIILVEKHNEEYPVQYIKEHYPNAEILDIERGKNPAFSGGPHADYILFDNEKQIIFSQDFSPKGLGGRLEPYIYIDYDPYEEALAMREGCDRCLAVIPEVYDEEYIARCNPESSSGVLIFIHKCDVEKFAALCRALTEFVRNEYFPSKSERGQYIEFTVFVCGDELYDRVSRFDFTQYAKDHASGSIFQMTAFDVAKLINAEVTRISVCTEDAIPYDFYYSPGDPSYKDYRDPADFDETLIVFDGEPNDQSACVVVFGVDYAE